MQLVTKQWHSLLQDGAAALYHNNVSIMSTAATGISVAGDVVATDDLILDHDAAVITVW